MPYEGSSKRYEGVALSKPQTLLVVDDNPVNLQLLHKFLASAGYRVLVAEDGESALTQAAEVVPDLILLDVLLPGISGFDACRALRRQETTASIPVIFLTALSRTSDKIEGFRAGGVDFLTKPLQLEEVLARVKVHLELQSLRHELEASNEELRQRDRRRERLLSIIAHDLKAPMAAFVNGTRDLARRSPEDPAFGELVDVLAERAERMDLFLGSLLEWGRLQVSSRSLATESFGLRESVESVIEHVREAAEAKQIDIRNKVSPELMVDQNRTALQTVLINLITNAIKFTDRGGLVEIRAERTESNESSRELRISVRDTGIGMSREQVGRLFLSESRIQQPGTDGESGNGLGLLLLHDLVARMSGAVEVESTPNKGSVFTVTLPSSPISDQPGKP